MTATLRILSKFFFWFFISLFLLVMAGAAYAAENPPAAKEEHEVLDIGTYHMLACQDPTGHLYFLGRDSVAQRADVILENGKRGIVVVLIDTEGEKHIVTSDEPQHDNCHMLYLYGPT